MSNINTAYVERNVWCDLSNNLINALNSDKTSPKMAFE
jgi:hypothetical protein